MFGSAAAAQAHVALLQTYSDGSVVRLIDLTTPGQAEPEHPAPVLTLSAQTAGATPAVSAAAAAPTTTRDDGLPIALGVAGAVLALAGRVLGAIAFAHTRRTESGPAPAVEGGCPRRLRAEARRTAPAGSTSRRTVAAGLMLIR